MVEVVFTIQSIFDIEDIAKYISNDSPYYASLQVEKFFNSVRILERFPLTGRKVPELNVKTIREIIEGNYRIIYKIVDKNLIHILTVHHSRRLLNRSQIRRVIRQNKP